MTHNVVLFLSTGRCGTQWIREELRRLYGSEIHVCHEPIGGHYAAKTYLRSHNSGFSPTPTPSKVTEHLGEIEKIVRSKTYVETGWPCFAAIPQFLERFGDALRCIHVPRHPVEYALSLMTHHYYSEHRDDECTQFMQLDPHDPGVRHKEYASRWAEMDQFEKCLFLWCEIHTFIEEMKPSLGSRCMTLSYEQIFRHGRGLAPITEFLNFEGRGDGHLSSTVDRWQASLGLVVLA